jgi:TolB-like protein
MFTDIVGYTALMGDDEQKAFDLLNKNRQLQKTLIEQNNGKWIKELGDGVLASFSTVIDAVNSACAIMKGCADIEGLQLRIGIHLGDVVFDNDDVFGDGVNIASRLQALASPGAICISEAVHRSISNKKEINSRFIREENLKHVREPVKIYEVTIEGATTPLTASSSAKSFPPGEKQLLGNRKNPTRLFIAGITIFLLAATALGYWFYNNGTTKQIKSIAVMPFVNESGNADIEYLSDGMTETLISNLSRLPDLDVKARSSVFRYKGKEANAQTIGKELNVEAILTGRLVQRGQDLALYTELVDAQKETVLWSQDYKQPMASLVSLQSEVTRDVVQNLKTKLSGADEHKLAKNYTANSEAYQLYLKGRYYYNKRTLKDLDKSIDYYQQAITRDPNYAVAYAGLVDSYSTLLSGTNSPENMPKAREAARKALLLDDKLAEAHAAYGRVLQVYHYNFTAAEMECLRAIELDPAYAPAYAGYASVLADQGRFEEAFTEIRRALELEPLNLLFSSTYGLILIYARRYDEAVEQLKRTLELDADFHSAHNFLSFVYWVKGAYAQSVEERAKILEINGDRQKAALVRESFAKGGWREFLRVSVRESITFGSRFYSLAAYYTALGEKDSAFAVLTQAYENREPLVSIIKVDPRLDTLRNDPRFQQFVQRVGFK